METCLSRKPSSLSPPLGAPDPRGGQLYTDQPPAGFATESARCCHLPPSVDPPVGAQRAADLNIRPRATAVPTRAPAVVHQDSERPQWLDSPRRLAALEDRSRRALDSGSVPSETGKAERTEPLVRVATHLWPRRAGRPLCGGCDAPLSPISDSRLDSRASTSCHTNRTRASRHALEPGWRPGATRPPVAYLTPSSEHTPTTRTAEDLPGRSARHPSIGTNGQKWTDKNGPRSRGLYALARGPCLSDGPNGRAHQREDHHEWTTRPSVLGHTRSHRGLRSRAPRSHR